MNVLIRGKVLLEANGVVNLEIPSAVLSKEQERMLLDLFPHSRRQVEDLLEREAVLASVLTEAEVLALPTGTETPVGLSDADAMNLAWNESARALPKPKRKE